MLENPNLQIINLKNITIAIITILLICCNCKKKTAEVIPAIQKTETIQEFLEKCVQSEEETAQTNKRF